MKEHRTRSGAVPLFVSVILFVPTIANAQVQLEPPRIVEPVPVRKPSLPPFLSLDDLLRISLDQNPNLRQADFEIDAARGRAIQAGLYPNPTVNVILDELGDREGPKGINTLPLVSQEIVTAGKRRLSRAVAQREVDQAWLAHVRQRYALFTTVRQGYVEVLAVRRRIEVLGDLAKTARQSLENARQLRKQELAADIDVLPLDVEFNRLQADLDAAKREESAAWGRLVATLGVIDLPPSPLVGSLDAGLPDYAFEPAHALMLESHPDIRSAYLGVQRAELALQKAHAETIPNVTVGAGYVRQNQNQSDDWTLQIGVPVPVFNRSQGNKRAAQAELGRALEEVNRVRNDLTNRLWMAFGQYSAARERAERYRTSVLPAARRSYELALNAFRGGQFEYLRVIQAQRAVSEADLDYVRSLAEAWKAASEIAGLLLEEHWPR